MATPALNPNIAAKIVADWRTGEYSQQDLSNKHKVSKGKVNNLCKGVAQDAAAIVTAGVNYTQSLSAIGEHDDRIVTAVTDAVNRITEGNNFYNSAQRFVSKVAILGIKKMLDTNGKPNSEFSMAAVNQASSAISTSRVGELGKAPDTAIQINNQQPQQPMTREQLVMLAEERGLPTKIFQQ
jgi:hypothetical protein